jgi:CBS domain-containing protein
MLCKDVMTDRVVCCAAGQPVSAAARLMRDHEIGAVPVVESDETRRLRGIVTDRDIVISVVSRGLDPGRTAVEDVMSTEIVSCRGEDDVDRALEAMERNQVRRILVADADGMLLGIISQADVATRFARPERTGEVVREISYPEPRGD